MAVDRATPTSGPMSGTTYAGAVDDEIGALWDASALWLDGVAGTDTITATVTPTLDAYAKGQHYWLVPAATNTGAVTLNIDSRGARAVVDADGAALAGGELIAGRLVLIVDDGTELRLVGGDSEAGTFTPTFTFAVPGDLSVVYTTQLGSYVKHGRLVVAWVELAFTPTHTTASNIAKVEGLPFTSLSGGPDFAGSIALMENVVWNSLDKMIGAYVVANSSEVWFPRTRDGLGSALMGTAHFPSGTAFTLTFGVSYRI